MPISSTVADFNGCFGVGAGLNVYAGASAAFFGIFNPNVTMPLLSTDFEIFKAGFNLGRVLTVTFCKPYVLRNVLVVLNWYNNGEKERHHRHRRLGYMSVDPARKLEDRALALTCPVLGTLPLLSIADQTISAIGRALSYYR